MHIVATMVSQKATRFYDRKNEIDESAFNVMAFPGSIRKSIKNMSSLSTKVGSCFVKPLGF